MKLKDEQVLVRGRWAGRACQACECCVCMSSGGSSTMGRTWGPGTVRFVVGLHRPGCGVRNSSGRMYPLVRRQVQSSG